MVDNYLLTHPSSPFMSYSPDKYERGETAAFDEETADIRRRERTEKALAKVHAIRTFNAAETGDLAFLGRSLVQLTLPHTDPGDIPLYQRRNGELILVVERGSYEDNGEAVLAGIPFGSYPRLVLAWLTTEAVRTRNQTLSLGASLTAFMNELGVTQGGRTTTLLREQMRRLFASRIAILKAAKGMDRASIQVANRTRLWWDETDASEPVDIGSVVRLSDDFFHLITERPVPLDMRALQVLKTSPLGLDLYAWLTYRVSYMKHETVIPWKNLEAQLGTDYGQTKDFTQKVKRELKKIKLVWPELQYRTPRGRLVLKPCPPHVSPRLKA